MSALSQVADTTRAFRRPGLQPPRKRSVTKRALAPEAAPVVQTLVCALILRPPNSALTNAPLVFCSLLGGVTTCP